SAQTRLERAGDTVTPSLPRGPVGRPGQREISVQLSPPSVERKSPLPGPPLEMFQKFRRVCQKAANRMRGLRGSIARSTAPVLASRYRTLLQLLPPSRDRNNPRSSLAPKTSPSAA